MNTTNVALVTGATRGIGFETACHLANNGYHVYATFRSTVSDVSQLNAAIQKYPGKLKKIELHLESDESIRNALRKVFKKEGKIDVLINNAMTIVDGPVLSINRQQMEHMMAINCYGPMVISQAVADQMRQAKLPLRLIFIGSAVDIAPNPAQGAYSVSKSALRSLAESLSAELQPLQDAKVSIIQLGAAATHSLLNAPYGARIYKDRDQHPLYNKSAQEISKKGLEMGMKPSKVAEKIIEVIQDPNPKLRVQIDDFTQELVKKFPPDGTGQDEFALGFLKMCGYISPPSEENKVLEPWEVDYQSLLKAQNARGVHPLDEDNPDVINATVSSFIKIFQSAPENKKRILLDSSLLPKGKFDGIKTLGSTKPLFYIMFTSRTDALVVIEPYLINQDWLEKGPYRCTMIHCIIAGMEKLFSKQGNPFSVVEKLLKKFPHLKTEPNQFGTTPHSYILDTALPLLKDNLRFTSSHGGGGWAGLGMMNTFTDTNGGSYNQTSGECEEAISEAKKIIKLLE